jgi:hypothetical protein
MLSGLIEIDKGRGIFSWEKTVIDCLANRMKLGDVVRYRQLCMLAYLFELGYVWMISLKCNLSPMPGFEAAGLMSLKKDS